MFSFRAADFGGQNRITVRNISSDKSAKTFVKPTSRNGFVPRFPLLHGFYNRSVGLFLLISVLPLFIVVTICVAATQGRSVFYGGERIGKDRKPFRIYKFRTLETESASRLTADKVLPRDAGIETPLGKYLRASRLDELPQLWNVVNGDMNIVGPRPVRESIAKLEEAKNPNYPIRYAVKPGLIGPTQAFMSHGTSKRLRARYNYELCTSTVRYRTEIALFLHVGMAVLAKSARLIADRISDVTAEQKSAKIAQDWNLRFETEHGDVHAVFGFRNMQIKLANPCARCRGKLIIYTKRGLRRATVDLVPTRSNASMTVHNIVPANEFAAHLIDRYLMDEPVVSPKPRNRKRVWRNLNADNKFHEFEVG